MSQITTHILDTALGKPAANVPVAFSHALVAEPGDVADDWLLISAAKTNSDGRIADLLDADTILAAGIYRLRFDTKSYFKDLQQKAFFPYADVVFVVEEATEGNAPHYHIPLLLSPYSYSTYRGS